MTPLPRETISRRLRQILRRYCKMPSGQMPAEGLRAEHWMNNYEGKSRLFHVTLRINPLGGI